MKRNFIISSGRSPHKSYRATRLILTCNRGVFKCLWSNTPQSVRAHKNEMRFVGVHAVRALILSV
jgi:hypothetical protein